MSDILLTDTELLELYNESTCVPSDGLFDFVGTVKVAAVRKVVEWLDQEIMEKLRKAAGLEKES